MDIGGALNGALTDVGNLFMAIGTFVWSVASWFFSIAIDPAFIVNPLIRDLTPVYKGAYTHFLLPLLPLIAIFIVAFAVYRYFRGQYAGVLRTLGSGILSVVLVVVLYAEFPFVFKVVDDLALQTTSSVMTMLETTLSAGHITNAKQPVDGLATTYLTEPWELMQFGFLLPGVSNYELQGGISGQTYQTLLSNLAQTDSAWSQAVKVNGISYPSLLQYAFSVPYPSQVTVPLSSSTVTITGLGTPYGATMAPDWRNVFYAFSGQEQQSAIANSFFVKGQQTVTGASSAPNNNGSVDENHFFSGSGNVALIFLTALLSLVPLAFTLYTGFQLLMRELQFFFKLGQGIFSIPLLMIPEKGPEHTKQWLRQSLGHLVERFGTGVYFAITVGLGSLFENLIGTMITGNPELSMMIAMLFLAVWYLGAFIYREKLFFLTVHPLANAVGGSQGIAGKAFTNRLLRQQEWQKKADERLHQTQREREEENKEEPKRGRRTQSIRSWQNNKEPNTTLSPVDLTREQDQAAQESANRTVNRAMKDVPEDVPQEQTSQEHEQIERRVVDDREVNPPILSSFASITEQRPTSSFERMVRQDGWSSDTIGPNQERQGTEPTSSGNRYTTDQATSSFAGNSSSDLTPTVRENTPTYEEAKAWVAQQRFGITHLNLKRAMDIDESKADQWMKRLADEKQIERNGRMWNAVAQEIQASVPVDEGKIDEKQVDNVDGNGMSNPVETKATVETKDEITAKQDGSSTSEEIHTEPNTDHPLTRDLTHATISASEQAEGKKFQLTQPAVLPHDETTLQSELQKDASENASPIEQGKTEDHEPLQDTRNHDHDKPLVEQASPKEPKEPKEQAKDTSPRNEPKTQEPERSAKVANGNPIATPLPRNEQNSISNPQQKPIKMHFTPVTPLPKNEAMNETKADVAPKVDKDGSKAAMPNTPENKDAAKENNVPEPKEIAKASDGQAETGNVPKADVAKAPPRIKQWTRRVGTRTQKIMQSDPARMATKTSATVARQGYRITKGTMRGTAKVALASGKTLARVMEWHADRLGNPSPGNLIQDFQTYMLSPSQTEQKLKVMRQTGQQIGGMVKSPLQRSFVVKKGRVAVKKMGKSAAQRLKMVAKDWLSEEEP